VEKPILIGSSGNARIVRGISAGLSHAAVSPTWGSVSVPVVAHFRWRALLPTGLKSNLTTRDGIPLTQLHTANLPHRRGPNSLKGVPRQTTSRRCRSARPITTSGTCRASFIRPNFQRGTPHVRAHVYARRDGVPRLVGGATSKAGQLGGPMSHPMCSRQVGVRAQPTFWEAIRPTRRCCAPRPVRPARNTWRTPWFFQSRLTAGGIRHARPRSAFRPRGLPRFVDQRIDEGPASRTTPPRIAGRGGKNRARPIPSDVAGTPDGRSSVCTSRSVPPNMVLARHVASTMPEWSGRAVPGLRPRGGIFDRGARYQLGGVGNWLQVIWGVRPVDRRHRRANSFQCVVDARVFAQQSMKTRNSTKQAAVFMFGDAWRAELDRGGVGLHHGGPGCVEHETLLHPPAYRAGR